MGSEIAALGSGRTGVGGPLSRLGSGRQEDRGRGLVDGQPPAVAGDVPVEFVVVSELPDLAVGGVGQFIRVFARVEEFPLFAHVDLDAVAGRLGMVVFAASVAANAYDFKSHRHGLAARDVVAGGEFAHDALADGLAGGQHAQGLDHGEIAVGGDGHPAVKGQEAFGLGNGGAGQGGQQAQGRKRRAPGKERADEARKNAFDKGWPARRQTRFPRGRHERAAGQASRPVHEPAPASKLTRGTARSAGSSISK